MNRSTTHTASMLTDRQLAERLNVSRSFVWKLHSQGRLPMPIKLGRACRWRVADVEAWELAGCPARGQEGSNHA